MSDITVTGTADHWQAWAGEELAGTLRAVVRPDQRCALLPRDCRDAAFEPLLQRALAELDRDLYLAVADLSEAQSAALTGLGFRPWRREHRYQIPVEPDRFPAVSPPPGVALVSAADADLDRLRRLDEALRDEIPGSGGWRWDPADFEEETFSTGFDPAAYLVAVEQPAGQHIGLLRVWLRPDNPRVGCIGVVARWRRTRVTAALLRAVAVAAYERGVREVTTEVDVTNRASNALAARVGAIRTGSVHHLLRPATVPAR